MVKYREIIRLKSQDYSNTSVATSTASSAEMSRSFLTSVFAGLHYVVYCINLHYFSFFGGFTGNATIFFPASPFSEVSQAPYLINGLSANMAEEKHLVA